MSETTFRTSLLPTAPWGAAVTVCDECEAIVMNPAGHAEWHARWRVGPPRQEGK